MSKDKIEKAPETTEDERTIIEGPPDNTLPEGVKDNPIMQGTADAEPEHDTKHPTK